MPILSVHFVHTKLILLIEYLVLGYIVFICLIEEDSPLLRWSQSGSKMSSQISFRFESTRRSGFEMPRNLRWLYHLSIDIHGEAVTILLPFVIGTFCCLPSYLEARYTKRGLSIVRQLASILSLPHPGPPYVLEPVCTTCLPRLSALCVQHLVSMSMALGNWFIL